jgi:acetyl-CoA carboxylase carboxyl transferase subunit alpha
MANTLKMYLLRSIKELRHLPVEELLEGRYQKFRRMGLFENKGPAVGGEAGDNGLPGPLPGP